MNDDSILRRLSDLETGQVSDILDEAGLPNHALSSKLFPLIPGKRFTGRAACLRGEQIVQSKPHSAPQPQDILEKMTNNGTVIVIDTGGFQSGAILGGFVAYSLMRAGCTAIVTDGAIRDADEIRELDLQCIQSTITPLNGSRRWRMVAAGEGVSLPGQSHSHVHIQPGDYLLGDSDGVVVIPSKFIIQIIEDTERLKQIETKIRNELHSGEYRRDVFQSNPRFEHVRPAV